MLKKLNKNDSIKTVLIFLALEILAFVSFSFGSFNWIFIYLGIAIGFASLMFLNNIVTSKEVKSNLFILVPLFLIAVLSALSKFSSQSFKSWINVSSFLGIILFYVFNKLQFILLIFYFDFFSVFF